jgi:hypothetical protein
LLLLIVVPGESDCVKGDCPLKGIIVASLLLGDRLRRRGDPRMVSGELRESRRKRGNEHAPCHDVWFPGPPALERPRGVGEMRRGRRALPGGDSVCTLSADHPSRERLDKPAPDIAAEGRRLASWLSVSQLCGFIFIRPPAKPTASGSYCGGLSSHNPILLPIFEPSISVPQVLLVPHKQRWRICRMRSS